MSCGTSNIHCLHCLSNHMLEGVWNVLYSPHGSLPSTNFLINHPQHANLHSFITTSHHNNPNSLHPDNDDNNHYSTFILFHNHGIRGTGMLDSRMPNDV